MADGKAVAFGVKLSAVQRRAVRGARSATLRVTYASTAAGRTTSGTRTLRLRVR